MSSHQESCDSANHPGPLNLSKGLEMLLSQPGNRVCADCGSPDPKWVSLNHGVFICIKCSGIHRSLGVHISKVLSVNLDEWTNDQIESLIERGGNTAVNMRYEAFLPMDVKKPKPDALLEERFDFIRRKYELQQFSTVQTVPASTVSPTVVPKDKYFEKQHTGIRHGRLAQAFRNSWRKKGSEQKTFGMTCWTRIPSARMTKWGIAEIDVQPLVALAKAHENYSLNGSSAPPIEVGKWLATEHDTTLVEHSIFSLVEGNKVKQTITLRLQNVESGHLDMELECIPLTQ